MVIYLIETDYNKAAFEDAEQAVDVAVGFIEHPRQKKAVRQIFSDYGGFNSLQVDLFDRDALTAYIETMQINRKVILQLSLPQEATERQVKIHKLFLEVHNAKEHQPLQLTAYC